MKSILPMRILRKVQGGRKTYSRCPAGRQDLWALPRQSDSPPHLPCDWSVAAGVSDAKGQPLEHVASSVGN